MDISGGDLVKIIITVASVTYSVVFGMIAKKVFEVPKTVSAKLDEYSMKMDERLKRIDEESKLAHRRLNVHDRISSKMSGKDFDSRAIAETGSYPDIRVSNDA